ncbi:hypothetical protein [Herbaspirillum sp. SJZ099]|uniref:hypothetical protein n=1 Tax=Herbaspirillum sp. SJZ099 TaxID=2572916 RepID=UPI001648E6DA|nr:hypothetical protein [Herbaspirillum sp. SJZ099]
MRNKEKGGAARHTLFEGKFSNDCAQQYPIGEAGWIMKNTSVYYQKNVFEKQDG